MLKFPKFVYNNKFSLPSLPPPGTFSSQTILITGASTGLGLAAAVHFVNLGAKSVIITARSTSKGLTAKTTIEAQTKCPQDVVKVMELDMSTFAGTKDFAERVKKEVKSVDYVLLNAGVLNTKFKMGEEGYEETIQVNALSTALLGLLMLPWMKEAGHGKAHLGFVTSGRHKDVDISATGSWPQKNIFQYLSKAEHWPASGMYPESKLLEQYIVNEIAKLAIGPNGVPQVIVNSMCPGWVKTDLARSYKTNIIASIGIEAIMLSISKTTEGGARTLVLAGLTTSKENGTYVTHYQSDEDYKVVAEKMVFGTGGKKMQAVVWKEVLDILKEKNPEVARIAMP